jgi:hypothetical protein
MIINHNINNLSGGVSNQPSEARFDTQVDEMINFEPYVTGEIRKRNPLEPINTIHDHDDNMAIHSYNRGDGLEKYGMTLCDHGLKVYDTSGNEKVVNTVGTINPLTQWAGSDWKKDISFLTVGDTTWILNKNAIVTSSADLTPEYTNSNRQAFYWANRSFDNGQNVGYTYEITLNGTKFSTNKTTTLTAISTLASAISAAGYTVKYSSSVMRITKATDFTFESGDSWGNQASRGWRTSISKISDLPSDMSGFTTDEVGIVEITGTDRNEFTSYYLRWDTVDNLWAETVASGIEYKLNAETLPAKIVRISDGTFELGFNYDLSTEGFGMTLILCHLLLEQI